MLRRKKENKRLKQKKGHSSFCVFVFQYQTMVSHRPAALWEHQRSPPWSSWWSSPVSATTSAWAWAPSPPVRLAPSQAISSGSQLWTDSTPSVAGTHLTCWIPGYLQAATVLFINLLIRADSTNRSVAALRILVYRICNPAGSFVSPQYVKWPAGSPPSPGWQKFDVSQLRQLNSNSCCCTKTDMLWLMQS